MVFKIFISENGHLLLPNLKIGFELLNFGLNGGSGLKIGRRIHIFGSEMTIVFKNKRPPSPPPPPLA